MHKKRLLVSVVSITLLATILILHIFGVTGTGTRVEFQTIAKGTPFSGYENSGYYVINDAEQWSEMRNQTAKSLSILQPSLPDVDFSESTVIAVFLGSCPTSGYGIEIKEVIDTGLSVVVKVEKTHPGEGCGVFTMFTYPYHIVKVGKIDKYILFNTLTSATSLS